MIYRKGIEIMIKMFISTLWTIEIMICPKCNMCKLNNPVTGLKMKPIKKLTRKVCKTIAETSTPRCRANVFAM